MTIKDLNHVAIQVLDVKRSVDFYTQVVGLPLMPRPDFGFPGAWFRIGTNQELHIIQSEKGGMAVASGSRGNHYAFQVTGLDDYPAKVQGHTTWTKGPVVRPDNARQFYFQDPDGHTIELVEYPA